MTAPDKFRCDACPVMCYIAPGQTGACDRYANLDGRIVRSDPLTLLDRTLQALTTGRPGPAHFEVPVDVLRKEYSEPLPPAPPTPAPQAPAPGTWQHSPQSSWPGNAP